MRRLLAIVLVGGCAGSGQATHPAGAAGADDIALATRITDAARDHKPLVVELGATWCAPCHVFSDEVLPDPRVQAALATIAFVQYDVDTPAGADAMRRCGAAALPALVRLDRDGSVQLIRNGFVPTTDAFLAFLGDAGAR